MSNVIVLGAGIAGCGAVYQLAAEGVSSTMFEQKPYAGGHTASFHHREGFIFDDGPHISFTTNERIQCLLAENVNQAFETIHARVNNYWQGYWIKHPAQINLHGLPDKLLVDILCDMVEARQRADAPITNYAEWLVSSFGETFARTFPMQYGLKYHTTAAANMTTDWLGPRLYRPELRQVFEGVVAASTPDVHYISNFRYPSHGGFASYLTPFYRHTDLQLSHELVELDPRAKTVRFANGRVVTYGEVISSIPLPSLIPLIAGTPADVLDAAGKLACSTCVIVNIGVNREDISPAHWTYFYDPEICFTRISFPHMLSPHNVPPGCGSIQCELYYSKKYRPLDRRPQDLIQPTVDDLQKCGLLREDDQLLFTNATLAPYANVIFDHDRAPALEIVHGYLESIGVIWCGRYGAWGYQWTDESFVTGELAAQKALERVGSRGVSA
jgi:protoporphyrinogen oxidase